MIVIVVHSVYSDGEFIQIHLILFEEFRQTEQTEVNEYIKSETMKIAQKIRTRLMNFSA